MLVKVLSLFDGISCARIALERIGCKIEKYYSSEIDKYAIQITQKNYPDTIQIGSVVGYHIKDKINLLIGGSPCQDLSISTKNRKGLDGERSGLFWEYVRILNETTPDYFILENVNSMSKDAKQIITDTLKVEPIMINSSLVSAQSRKRLFWTNIKNVILPKNRNIVLKDILEDEFDEKLCLPIKKYDMIKMNIKKNVVITGSDVVINNMNGSIRLGQVGAGSQGNRIYSIEGKSVSLMTDCAGLYLMEDGKTIRELTPIECERLQSIPDNYTEGISNNQRYKCIGNAFNVDVVAHILSFVGR